jgi:trehalose 6-phosphate phosphatase
MKTTPDWIVYRFQAANGLCLFLDYDGTLVDFSPTPAQLDVNPETVQLLQELTQLNHVQVSVVSGRRLEDLKKLLPVEGVLLAGTYGIELQTPQGEHIQRESYGMVRPQLEKLKPQWERLIEAYPGFYLEDKGWSLAIHGRFAPPDKVEQILSQATKIAGKLVNSTDYRILGGDRFTELAPLKANKGDTIRYLVDRLACHQALLVYMGDDDKDEDAFKVIKKMNGIAVLVSPDDRLSVADFRLESPRQARRWLAQITTNYAPPQK